jgi:hypothetical protein
LFEAYGRRRKTGAAHFDPIIKHPDLDGGARDSIIPVRDRIDQSFLPSKSGILESLSEKQVVEHCPLPDVFFDPTHSFINEAREGSFEANALNHIQRRAVLPFGAFIFNEVDAAARVPKSGIFSEKKQTGHIGSRLTARRIDQMIGMSKNILRRPGVLNSRCQVCNSSLIQILPPRIQRLLPFVKHAALGFSESLNLFRGKRRCLSRDPIKRASTCDTIDFKGRSHLEFDEQKIAESNFC